MPVPARLVLVVGAILVAASMCLLAASGPGYGAGWWSLPGGFLLLRAAAWGGVAGGLLALTSLRWRRMLTRTAWLTLALTLAGAVVAAAVPAGWARVGRSVRLLAVTGYGQELRANREPSSLLEREFEHRPEPSPKCPDTLKYDADCSRE